MDKIERIKKQDKDIVSERKPGSTDEGYFERVPCPCCDSPVSVQLYPIDRVYASELSGIDLSGTKLGVSLCKDCGHQFIQPALKPAFIKRFYASYMTRAKEGFYRDRAAEKIPADFRLRYGRWLERLKAIGCRGTLLDAGTGLGMFLRLAKEYGFEVQGVEPNPETARTIKKVYDIGVHNCLLEELEIGERYDAVTMWDLLEHLTDPSALVQARRMLKRGGFLVIEIPVRDSIIHLAAKSLYRLSFGSVLRPLYLVYGVHHLQYFSSGSIKTLLEVSGFKVIESQGTETDLDALYIKSSKGFFNGLKASAYNTALRGAFCLGWLLGRRNKLVVFARKEGL